MSFAYTINKIFLLIGGLCLYSEYVKEKMLFDKSEEEKKIELFFSVLRAKKELETASQNFEYAEKELIDYYVYEIKASKAKFDFLMNLAKENGISFDLIHEIYYRKKKVG